MVTSDEYYQCLCPGLILPPTVKLTSLKDLTQLLTILTNDNFKFFYAVPTLDLTFFRGCLSGKLPPIHV